MQHAERLTLASRCESFSPLRRSWPPADIWPERTLQQRKTRRRYRQDQRSQPAADYSSEQYRHSGAVRVSPPQRRRFPRRYTPNDIALLAAVDAAHEGLSGPAVRHILRREYTVYNKAAYQRLASISAHLQLAAEGGLVNTTFITPRPAPAGCRSAILGPTRCIRETPRRTRASTTSTLSIRSRSGRSWAVARRSRKPI